MARIQRAQAKGKKDVRLSKEELAAFERHRQREEEEARKKRREQRIAVPLSQFELSSRQRRDSAEEDSPPRRHSPDQSGEQQRDVPPMGYFPPPSSRSLRPRSGTVSRPSSRAPADRDRGDSPFTYSYVHPEQGAPSRQPSDSAAGRPISRTSVRGDSGAPSPTGGSSNVSPATRLEAPQQPQVNIDPFQFMTGGVRAPYHSGAPSARRSVAVAPGDSPYAYGSGPVGERRRSNGSGGDSSGDDGNRADATPGHGARVNSSGSGSRGRADERPKPPEPERRSTRDRSPPSSSKKVSSILSPIRRKSIMGSSSSSSKSKRKGK